MEDEIDVFEIRRIGDTADLRQSRDDGTPYEARDIPMISGEIQDQAIANETGSTCHERTHCYAFGAPASSDIGTNKLLKARIAATSV